MRMLKWSYVTTNFKKCMDRLPFAISRNNKVIAIVSEPTSQWYECEVCGDNTQNLIKYEVKMESGDKVFKKLVLCDACRSKLL